MIDILNKYGFDVHPEVFDDVCSICVNTDDINVKDYYDVAIIKDY